MNKHQAEKTRYEGTVAIAYFSHFEQTDIHDWVPIREWNGPYHPVLGEYTTSDRDIVRTHLQWLRRAGVDVIFYDVCRIHPEQNLFGLPEQKTLQLLVDELSHQEKETRKLKLAIWLERWNSNLPAEEYRFGFDYIRKNLANRDFYYQMDGKPLVVSYLNGAAAEHAIIEQENEPFFTIRHISSGRATPGWRYFGPAGDEECMTVNPGANGYMEEAFIKQFVHKQPVDAAALQNAGKRLSNSAPTANSSRIIFSRRAR